MKRTKQINESREMIVRAFKKLLGESDYKDITMSEIAAEAGLTRTTLYRHFERKDNLIIYIAEQVREKAWSNWRGDRDAIGEIIVSQLVETKKLPNRPVLVENEYVWATAQSFLESSWKDTLAAYIGSDVDEDGYLTLFLLAGFSRIYFEWLKNDCQESPRELGDKIMSYFARYREAG